MSILKSIKRNRHSYRAPYDMALSHNQSFIHWCTIQEYKLSIITWDSTVFVSYDVLYIQNIFIYSIGVLGCIPENYTYTTAASIITRGHSALPGGNPRPHAGCCLVLGSFDRDPLHISCSILVSIVRNTSVMLLSGNLSIPVRVIPLSLDQH